MSNRTTFYIEWGGSADLDVRDIWPDGDAPENPTTDDVIAVMLKSWSIDRVLSEWSLDVEEIEVFGEGGRKSLTDRTFREARAKESPDA